MNSAFTTWRQRLLLTLLFVIIAMMLLSPLSFNTYIPNLWDMWNHVATIAHAKLALAEGQFLLRVAPTEMNGWRYPQFQFYSPTGYTIAGLIYQWVTPGNPFIAYKLTIIFSLVVGGLYFYRLAFWLVGSQPAALLAAVVYLTSPYYIIVINHVGGFNEAIALGILPAAVFYTIQRYYHPKDNKTLLQVSLIWYLFATIHFITFFYTSLMVALLLLSLTIKNRRHWLNLINVGIAYLFGCVLAMWYLGPIVVLGKYFAITRTMNKEMNIPFLTSLFSPTVNISGGVLHSNGLMNVVSQIHPNLGIPMLFALSVAVYALFSQSIIRRKRSGYWLPYLLMIFFIAFIMVWSPFNFWKQLPQFFTMFQYTWRLLSQVIWIGALLFAWAIVWIFKNQISTRQTILGIILIIVCSSAWLPITERSFLDASNFLKKPELITNPDSYVIDAKKNKHFIQAIDHITLNALMKETLSTNLLNLNSSYTISKDLIYSLPTLYISLSGQMPYHLSFRHQQLAVIVDKTTIKKFELKPGLFHWNIPLNHMKNILKERATLSLKFAIHHTHSNKKSSSELAIPVKKVVLTGFMNPSEILSVEETTKHCKQKNIDTICKINVPANIQLLELPILYYPDMLTISVNGKPVQYQNVFYHKYLLAAISPIPNQMNEIKIRFTGMLWANYFSILGWMLWGLFLIFIFLRTRGQA
ncbi:MAG TPA: hypothetical protein VJN02_08680 [Gammaproteobacteria bacterium]|nr:hypothetical protein [Gammaproteobacteria bacterium]